MTDDARGDREGRFRGAVDGEASLGAMSEACGDPERPLKLGALGQVEHDPKERSAFATLDRAAMPPGWTARMPEMPTSTN